MIKELNKYISNTKEVLLNKQAEKIDRKNIDLDVHIELGEKHE